MLWTFFRTILDSTLWSYQGILCPLVLTLVGISVGGGGRQAAGYCRAQTVWNSIGLVLRTCHSSANWVGSFRRVTPSRAMQQGIPHDPIRPTLSMVLAHLPLPPHHTTSSLLLFPPPHHHSPRLKAGGGCAPSSWCIVVYLCSCWLGNMTQDKIMMAMGRLKLRHMWQMSHCHHLTLHCWAAVDDDDDAVFEFLIVKRAKNRNWFASWYLTSSAGSVGIFIHSTHWLVVVYMCILLLIKAFQLPGGRDPRCRTTQVKNTWSFTVMIPLQCSKNWFPGLPHFTHLSWGNAGMKSPSMRWRCASSEAWVFGVVGLGQRCSKWNQTQVGQNEATPRCLAMRSHSGFGVSSCSSSWQSWWAQVDSML